MPPQIMNQLWPIDRRLGQRLLAWFREVRQPLPWRLESTPYRVWISEIMLQQTVITTVIPYFEKWMKAFPDINTLARASEQEVLLFWEGLGYYSRARNILKTASELVAHYQGELPSDYKALVKLPGIGDYTACAILSIAFKQPYPVVDANVRRIFQRIGNLDTMDKTAEFELKALLRELITGCQAKNEHEQPVNTAPAALPPGSSPSARPATTFAVPPVSVPAATFAVRPATVPAATSAARPACTPAINCAGDFNEALMQLGQTICKTKQPLCTQCCLAAFCQAFSQGRQNQIPAVKQQRTIAKKTALFIFLKDNQVLLIHKNKGPLKDLWSFPGAPWEEREQFLKEWGLKNSCKLTFLRALNVHTHYYTVYKDELIPLVYRLEEFSPAATPRVDTEPGTWIALEQLKNYPFPSVYRKIITGL